MHSLERIIRSIYLELEHLGYKPVIIRYLCVDSSRLASANVAMGARVDVQRLRSLLRSVAGEVEPSKYMVARKRVEALIRKMFSVEEGGGGVE